MSCSESFCASKASIIDCVELVLMTYCSETSSSADIVNVGGPTNCGSLPDLLNVTIQPPLMTDVDSSLPSLPSYDMAVATSNRQLPQPVLLPENHAKTRLMSGGSAVMIVPQVVPLHHHHDKNATTLQSAVTDFHSFYSVAALLAMQSAVLATVMCLSVCLSVTRWYPIQTNEDRITWSSL